MRRIVALLATAVASAVVGVLACSAQAGGTPFRATVPINATFQICSTGHQIDFTGWATVFGNEPTDQQSGLLIHMGHTLMTGTGTDQATGLTYRLTTVDHLVTRGDTEDPSFTYMETLLVQFRPLSGGPPLFGHMTLKEVYNSPGTFSFTQISGDEACLTL